MDINQDDIPWCILFANDMVLIDETRKGTNSKIAVFGETLWNLNVLEEQSKYIKYNPIRVDRETEDAMKVFRQDLEGYHFQKDKRT